MTYKINFYINFVHYTWDTSNYDSLGAGESNEEI